MLCCAWITTSRAIARQTTTPKYRALHHQHRVVLCVLWCAAHRDELPQGRPERDEQRHEDADDVEEGGVGLRGRPEHVHVREVDRVVGVQEDLALGAGGADGAAVRLVTSAPAQLAAAVVRGVLLQRPALSPNINTAPHDD